MSETSLRPEELIPHRDRMMLLDEIVEVNDARCVTRARVSECWPLREGLSVSSITLIEVVAQTASAAAGWRYRHDHSIGGEGYLVGVKQASWTAPSIPVGAMLTTVLESPRRTKSYGVFVGRVESDSGLSAEIHLQVVRP